MKILLQNYATSDTSEPLYISECVNSLAGLESFLWKDNSVSAFDMFDVIQPTTFITHYSLLSKDIIKYLSGNNKIECVLNVTGAEQQHIDMIDEIVATNKIQCPFIFTNQPSN